MTNDLQLRHPSAGQSEALEVDFEQFSFIDPVASREAYRVRRVLESSRIHGGRVSLRLE
jgi:hypothetical protein